MTSVTFFIEHDFLMIWIYFKYCIFPPSVE